MPGRAEQGGERPQYAAKYRMLFDTNVTAFNVYIGGVGHL